MRVLAVLIGFFCTASFGQEVVYLGSPCANGRCRVVNDTSTAQGVAELQAQRGRIGHFGGNTGYEGCGSGRTPQEALNNCCYSRNGWPVIDQGVAFGHGRWFACRRYGR